MAQSKLVLVTGATGKQGGACVEALLTRGHQVRALTRNSASPAANRLRERGVEITVGDFSDRDSLMRAARGADAVYAMSTPYEQGAEKETAQGITITDAARAARVGHFVYSSVASANRGTGIGHFDGKYTVEKHLQASGVPYTIVAPVFFMENLLQPWTLPSLRQGKLTMALPASRLLQQITVADTGRSWQRSLSAVTPSSVVVLISPGMSQRATKPQRFCPRSRGAKSAMKDFRQRSYVPGAKIWLGCSAGSVA